jgi:hypothetical protein
MSIPDKYSLVPSILGRVCSNGSRCRQDVTQRSRMPGTSLSGYGFSQLLAFVEGRTFSDVIHFFSVSLLLEVVSTTW